MKKEYDLQTVCNDFLRDNDILFFHKEKGRSKHKTHSKGLPDLLIWNNGNSIFIELKKNGGIQSENQKEWQEKSELAGIKYFLVDNYPDFIHALHTGGII